MYLGRMTTTVDSRSVRISSNQRVQRTDLPRTSAACPMTQCVYCKSGLCDEATINKGNSDAACHRMTNKAVLAMLTRAVRAATRDASWYRRPSTHGKDLVYHVVRAEVHAGEGACGVPVVAREGFAPKRDVTVAAERVRPEYRCRRPGCRQRWPAYAGD